MNVGEIYQRLSVLVSGLAGPMWVLAIYADGWRGARQADFVPVIFVAFAISAAVYALLFILSKVWALIVGRGVSKELYNFLAKKMRLRYGRTDGS